MLTENNGNRNNGFMFSLSYDVVTDNGHFPDAKCFIYATYLPQAKVIGEQFMKDCFAHCTIIRLKFIGCSHIKSLFELPLTRNNIALRNKRKGGNKVVITSVSQDWREI